MVQRHSAFEKLGEILELSSVDVQSKQFPDQLALMFDSSAAG